MTNAAPAGPPGLEVPEAAVGAEVGPLIFLIAGEPSGDLLGARLMAALKSQCGERVRFAGIGGAAMAVQGLESTVPIGDLTVMGLVEVLPYLPRIIGHMRRTAALVRLLRPDVLVTIDSPNFSLEVAKRVAGQGIPLVHYVAPSVWAWKPRRAKRMAGYLDRLLTLLPFEPPYFERHGLASTFVGHPAVEAAEAGGDPAAFRQSQGIPQDAPLICVLPGSRRSEVRRLLPVFGQTLGRLAAEFPALHAVAPTVPGVAGEVAAAAKSWPVPTAVLGDPAAKYQAFAAAGAAVAASGTVAVELAVAGVPTVIAYRLSPLSGFLAPLLLKIRYVSLPNILLDREVQPECLQRDCNAENLAKALARLLRDPAARAAQKEGARAAVAKLGGGGAETPSQRAARCILEVIQTGARARMS